MNRWFVRGFILVSAAGLLPGMTLAQDGNVDQAREALSRQEGDEDSSKQLEEVFQAAEKKLLTAEERYSLPELFV